MFGMTQIILCSGTIETSNIFVSFVCIFAYLCVQTFVCTHLCVYIWKPEDNIGYLPQLLSALVLKTESLSEPDACPFV